MIIVGREALILKEPPILDNAAEGFEVV